MEPEKKNEELLTETQEPEAGAEDSAKGSDAAMQAEEERNCSGREKGKEKEKKLSHREQKELETLKNQLTEKNEQMLRLAAEYDNYRKRTEKEKSECYVSAYRDALKAFLPLLDTLYEAKKYTPDDAGIIAMLKQANDILTKLGIKEMESDGAEFDPAFHEAVMHEENPDLGKNIVSQTFQRGYMLGERVLRPAMVKVAN